MSRGVVACPRKQAVCLRGEKEGARAASQPQQVLCFQSHLDLTTLQGVLPHVPACSHSLLIREQFADALLCTRHPVRRLAQVLSK